MSVLDNFRSIQFTKLHAAILATTAAFSAVGGAAIGAKLAVDRLGDSLRAAADEAMQAELKASKDFYNKLYKAEEFLTPEDALNTLHPVEDRAVDALVRYSGGPGSDNIFVSSPQSKSDLLQVAKDVPTDVAYIQVAKNVFTDVAYIPGDFDYDEELKNRDPDKPYLITVDEFNANETDYDQLDFTYYEGDGVLANAAEEEVTNINATVGEDNLLRFGHGSEDENVVYVRNVNANMDISIVRSTGKYAVEVAGFDGDDITESGTLKHSYSLGIRKFRHRDT